MVWRDTWSQCFASRLAQNLLCMSWAKAEAQLISGHPALPALDRGGRGAQ